MTKLTEAEVTQALRTVIDPELNINIVELGLIYSIKIESEIAPYKVRILMTLTSPGCPLGAAIVRMIRDSLASFPGINPEQDVVVEIVFDPPWTQDMMSEEAKAELGF